MTKYENLVNVLDQIRFESPIEFKNYRPKQDDLEKINQARGRALIHLYLKVTFGILDFKSREKLVTDKGYDAGVDAYYIDTENKEVYFIQCKFRTNKDNFESKEISPNELLKMDIDRIVDGESCDEDGNEYNGKIKQLLREMSQVDDIGRYKYKVIILANLKSLKTSQVRKLTSGFSAEIFDNERIYKSLLFPVITGTYYNNNLLSISLSLTNKNSSSARISYNVETEFKECDITVVFVPTEEIGRILYTYKNSILKYNPRCFLEMKANSVNKEIHNTITQKKTNEFALFNNGITMLSDETSVNERIGQKDKAQIVVSNPQIINGGQTAFTLSRIYEDIQNGLENEDIFENKEVLLKIITFGQHSANSETKKRSLIESISKATNRQNEVSDADRRSNDKIQIDLQELLFNRFGYYYERKKGEFADGIKDKYISRNQIIERELLLRLAVCCDMQPAVARRSSGGFLFQESNFTKYLNNSERAVEYFYAFKIYQSINALEKSLREDINDRFGTSAYGQAIRYGRFAVTSVCVKKLYQGIESLNKTNEHLKYIIDQWIEFEKSAQGNAKNSLYFKTYHDEDSGMLKQDLNYEGYYKGRTIHDDLKRFFSI
ncbi:AIPR family protein [Aeromonas hydrophila]|uniref:AIPR family protein n=1 Tax=Aeromonas hydrophila TaxID=644 RepID=UPI002B4975E0|nr:AIPR family protein [Aeromonas hydrophila]